MSVLPGVEIYDGIEALGLAVNLQGWHSQHPLFAQLLRETCPKTIIEVGTWKGGSAIHMAGVWSDMATFGLHSKIYCVDTWLGSPEIWNNPNLKAKNPFKHGYPQVYFQFLHNVKAYGFAAVIVPLPMPSRIGANVLADESVTAELIYLDGSHDYTDVKSDCAHYWNLLQPGGVMFGNDYSWVGVHTAVDEFAFKRRIQVEDVEGNFWVIRKPL
jgi:predicted O-methyltransferase YrrM